MKLSVASILFFLCVSNFGKSIYFSSSILHEAKQTSNSASADVVSKIYGYDLSLGFSSSKWRWFKVGLEINNTQSSFKTDLQSEESNTTSFSFTPTISILLANSDVLEGMFGYGYAFHKFKKHPNDSNHGNVSFFRILINIGSYSLFFGTREFKLRKSFRNSTIYTGEVGLRYIVSF